MMTALPVFIWTITRPGTLMIRVVSRLSHSVPDTSKPSFKWSTAKFETIDFSLDASNESRNPENDRLLIIGEKSLFHSLTKWILSEND
jgi:hypothetical protein